MIRLKDIAEACGVSVATVSRALNGVTNENKERTAYICQTARQMGYYPNAAARTLKTSRSRNIGILYEDRMNHEYFSSLLDELRSAADERGYDLTLIGRTENGRETYYDHARRRNLDGVIVIQADFESQDVIRLAGSDIPTVVIDQNFEGCDCVSSDNRASVERIVRYAWEKGHRKIAYIHGDNNSVTRDRLSSFHRTLAQHKITVPDEYIKASRYRDGELTEKRMEELLDLPDPPTCVFMPDDFSAVGGYSAAQEKGLRIPDDISIIGYDGIPMSQALFPKLTTLKQDTKQIGKSAAEHLTSLIESPKTTLIEKILVDGYLLEGGSVRNLN